MLWTVACLAVLTPLTAALLSRASPTSSTRNTSMAVSCEQTVKLARATALFLTARVTVVLSLARVTVDCPWPA